MMDKEKHRDRKDFLVEEYRRSPEFAGHHIFASATLLKDILKAQFLGLMKVKRMIQL